MGEAFPVLRQPAATVQPGECPLHHPPLWQDHEPLRSIRAFDDLDVDVGQRAFHGRTKFRALIAAVGVEFEQERKSAEQGRHQHCAAVTILDIRAMHDGVDQEALRIDENVPLLALDFLARVIAMRVNAAPPFSADLTL